MDGYLIEWEDTIFLSIHGIAKVVGEFFRDIPT